MNPQYEILAKCLLPSHMLEWFELTNVEVKAMEKKSGSPRRSSAECSEAPLSPRRSSAEGSEASLCPRSSIAELFPKVCFDCKNTRNLSNHAIYSWKIAQIHLFFIFLAVLCIDSRKNDYICIVFRKRHTLSSAHFPCELPPQNRNEKSMTNIWGAYA